MYGNPPSYTWAARPRYKMAGCQMCSGENSVPTWPFHCFDKSILTIDRSPELTAVTPRPSVKNTPDGSILESRAPTTPVALRPVSASHAPAIVSAPGVQFRKDLRHPQKPSSGRRLRRDQRFFRNWAPGTEAQAGAWGRDEIRNITGTGGSFKSVSKYVFSGAIKLNSTTGTSDDATGKGPSSFSFDASLVVPTGPQVVPQHVWQPVCLYLGRPAQV